MRTIGNRVTAWPLCDSINGSNGYSQTFKNTSPLFRWTACTDSRAASAGSDGRFDCGSWNWVGNTTSATVSAQSDGTHTQFYVEAEDNANNIGASSSVTFTIDTTPPPTRAPSAPSSDVGTLTPTINWTAGSDIWKTDVEVDYEQPVVAVHGVMECDRTAADMTEK